MICLFQSFGTYCKASCTQIDIQLTINAHPKLNNQIMKWNFKILISTGIFELWIVD